MTSDALRSKSTAKSLDSVAFDMKLEVIVLPVSDVDRAKQFYGNLGWRLDIDFKAKDGYRVVQFTPPGSTCSVIFGSDVTAAAPGSAQGLHLVVSDLAAVREELMRRGVALSEPLHDTGGIFHHADAKGVAVGLNPRRHSYASFASFTDPDGNGWWLQEVTSRLSGDLQLGDPRFTPQILNAIHGLPAE